MFSIPSSAKPVFMSLSGAFSARTFRHVLVLMVGAILAPVRRTVTAALRAAGPLVEAHFSTYHRVFSRARWSLWPLGKVLATMVVSCIPADQAVLVAADDTVVGHKGRKVYGKDKHRDAVRSSHSLTVWRWGHKWVVLAVLVPFPFAHRPWALPVLAALYRSRQRNQAEGRRHKTPIDLARQLMAALIHWFPQRNFVLLGDGGYASHELARFCYDHRQHVTLISRFHPQANLHAPPPKLRGQIGRPRQKGRKLPGPHQIVDRSPRQRATVGWYGGQNRRVDLVSRTGHWYKGGDGLVPIRWVFVHDVQGTHRDEYFYGTAPWLPPEAIVTLFTRRWSIEVTFEELRAHLGFETPRNYVAPSVLRTAPCLLGLFSVVSLVFAQQARGHRIRVGQSQWYSKAEPTFSDALATVRRLFWAETILQGSCTHNGLTKLKPRIRNLLLDFLSQAA